MNNRNHAPHPLQRNRTKTVRFLLVEDDIMIARFIIKGLDQAGFTIDLAEDGVKGLHLALSEDYDLVIVDVILPELDGLSLVKRLRDVNKRIPIIILSAKRSVEDRIQGLQTGCDDYLVKPFVFAELLARIQALLRRASGASEPTILTAGDLVLDIAKWQVTRGSRSIRLQAKEFSLLEYLMRNQDKVVSKTMIVQHVWNYDFDPQTNVVESRISKLRVKIEQNGESKLIHTIRGVGYVLKDETGT